MREEAFKHAVRSFSSAVPFCPFTVELHTRVRLVVRCPESLFLDQLGIALLVEADGTVQLFDASSAARVASVVTPPNAK